VVLIASVVFPEAPWWLPAGCGAVLVSCWIVLPLAIRILDTRHDAADAARPSGG
jgi:hypothetical protein